MKDLRISRLRKQLAKLGINGLLISNYYNILYLTGFKTLTTDEREAYVLVTKNNTYLFTDGRYLTKNYLLRITDYELKLIEPGKSVLFHLQEIISKENIKTLGIEADDLRVQELEKLKQTFPTLKFVLTDKLVVRQREIKDESEIKKITKACQIVDRCLHEIIKTITVGMKEKDLAFRLEMWLKRNGYDLAFDPIVAVNKNSAIPHYKTKDGDSRIEKQSVILIDFGAKFENYLSDITRMIFVNPETEMVTSYEKLRQLQKKVISYITVGKPTKDLDRLSRQLHSFSHSLGHGVGLEIHEYPKLSSLSTDVIANNQVFTVEPGIYYPEKWGMRIEDTVVVVNGKAQALTRFPKILLRV